MAHLLSSELHTRYKGLYNNQTKFGRSSCRTFAPGGAATRSTIRCAVCSKSEKIVGPYVRPGMTVMDVGCGMGFCSIAMAKIVGDNGLVIAVDLQQKMLECCGSEPGGGRRRSNPLHKCEQDRLGVDAQADFALAFMMVLKYRINGDCWAKSRLASSRAGNFWWPSPRSMFLVRHLPTR